MKMKEDLIIFYEDRLMFVGNSDKINLREFVQKTKNIFESRFGQELPLGTYYGRNKYNDFVGVVEIGICDVKKTLQ